FLRALDRACREHRLSLDDPAAATKALELASDGIQRALNNKSMLYGLHAQSMFWSLALSLGRIRLLKEEDEGNLYNGDAAIRPPDFFMALTDGTRAFVEVKNQHVTPANPLRPVRLKRSYIESLRAYVDLVGLSLKFAVFWTGWRMWTLSPVE